MTRTFRTPKGTDLPLIMLKGKEYLQVAHRLVWFREDHPDWSIKTDFIRLENDFTIARAEILDASGRVIASGHKREDGSHFADHTEKAETGAIGRALAYCGYGTQFCAEEIEEGPRVVDAPQVPPKSEVPKSNGYHPTDECCGQPMMKDKFQPNSLYCFKCKSRKSFAGARA